MSSTIVIFLVWGKPEYTFYDKLYAWQSEGYKTELWLKAESWEEIEELELKI